MGVVGPHMECSYPTSQAVEQTAVIIMYIIKNHALSLIETNPKVTFLPRQDTRSAFLLDLEIRSLWLRNV